MANFIISGFADEIDKDLDIQTKVLGKLGIGYLEMRGVDGKNISQYTPLQIKDVKKRIDLCGIKVSAVGSPIGKIKLSDDFEKELDSLKNLIELCNILQTGYIRMFSFYNAQDERNQVIDRLGKYLEISKAAGVTLLHENEKGIYGDVAGRCLDICETLGMGAIFDPANFVQCGENVMDAYNLLKPHIKYLHIKDAVALDRHVVPAGYGDGCLKEILTDLYANNFDGFLSLEPHLSNFTGFAELEDDAVNIQTDDSDELDGEKTFKLAFDSLNKILNTLRGC